jgi:thiamine biosynthesis lipoprotein
MNLSRRHFLAIAAVSTINRHALAQPMIRHRFHALGAEAEIQLIGESVQSKKVLLACQREVTAIESAFSLYQPNSTLSQLNRHGQVIADERFRTLLDHALEMADITAGAFDPTIQPLWTALARGGDRQLAQRLVNWRALQMTQNTARFTRTGMAASLNGIAQGFAADRVSSILNAYGFDNTLVNLGEFAISGARSGTPWRLGIRDPLTQRISAHIEPVGAVATSEPAATLIAGHSHIFDPLARPGERWASVTVQAREAWRADALSTAIAAAPLHQAPVMLQAGGATRAWLIKHSGTLHNWQA